MLIHYTSNLDAALSIINSGELWLKSVGETSDKEEVLHYINEFNRFHFIAERVLFLETLIKEKEKGETNSGNNFNDNFLTILEKLNLNLEFWKKDLTNGFEFSKILREEGHLICFTEEEGSIFHDKTYGKISFEFEENPLMNLDTHKFIQEKIIYFRTNLLKNPAGLDYDELYFLDDDVKYEELNSMKQDFKDVLESYEEVITPLMNEWYQKLGGTLFSDSDLISIISRINEEMSKKRIDKRLNLYVQKGLVPEKMKETQRRLSLLNDSIYYRQNLAATGLNFMSLFLKDESFIEDKETRIVALPYEKINEYNTFLQVPFDFKKLVRVRVGSEVDSRDDMINQLKQTLANKTTRTIEVI